jgi:hypothetical protein
MERHLGASDRRASRGLDVRGLLVVGHEGGGREAYDVCRPFRAHAPSCVEGDCSLVVKRL